MGLLICTETFQYIMFILNLATTSQYITSSSFVLVSFFKHFVVDFRKTIFLKGAKFKVQTIKYSNKRPKDKVIVDD